MVWRFCWPWLELRRQILPGARSWRRLCTWRAGVLLIPGGSKREHPLGRCSQGVRLFGVAAVCQTLHIGQRQLLLLIAQSIPLRQALLLFFSEFCCFISAGEELG